MTVTTVLKPIPLLSKVGIKEASYIYIAYKSRIYVYYILSSTPDTSLITKKRETPVEDALIQFVEIPEAELITDPSVDDS